MDKILLMVLNSSMYNYKQKNKQNYKQKNKQKYKLTDKKFTYILCMKYCNHFE
jgi:hypothetical protein